MKKYYTQEEMLDFLDSLASDVDVLESAGEEGIVESIRVRLSSQAQHIEYLRERLLLAEHVIGELYLMQRETDHV